MLLILTGKTASGKDTIMSRLLLRYLNLKRVVSTTTRPPRRGEVDGKDYNFVTREQFQQKIKDGLLIEFVEYGGNLYGTEKSQIIQNKTSDLIWRIDPSRAGEIREFLESAFGKGTDPLLKKILVVYLTVDDSAVLQRLKQRGLTETEIRRRLEEDQFFWSKYQDKYDYVVENKPGKLNEALAEICQIIESKPPQL